MNLQSLSIASDSDLGTVVGIAVFVLAVLGTEFLNWEWGASTNQPLPFAIGAIAAIIALYIAWQKF